MFYIVNNFSELTVPSFIIRLEDVENGATCLDNRHGNSQDST